MHEPSIKTDAGTLASGFVVLRAVLLLIACFGLTIGTGHFLTPSLSPLVPMAFGCLVAVTGGQREAVTLESGRTLIRWAVGLTVLSIGLVLLTPYRTFPDSWLNLWPMAILVLTAVVASRTKNARLAVGFYVALGLFVGNAILGLTLWQAILP